jgi:hypothetical protein
MPNVRKHIKRAFIFILFFFLIALLIIRYLLPVNPIGTYVAVNCKKTIDTIIVKSDDHYIRRIYDKSNRKLFFQNEGKWEYKNNDLTFYNFYVNDGDEVPPLGFPFDSTLMIVSYPLEITLFRNISFAFDEQPSYCRYVKE